ncbi:MAG: adenine deaminase [Balneolaceae bacterium]|nr:MAG: adenine deaminase [Balneolaceae bacterium]
MRTIKGIIIDVLNRRRFPGEMTIENGRIAGISTCEDVPELYLLPGFVDSHIHIESSMMVPSEFARLAVQHGTVATVSDPHEIANVCGMDGVRYMIENGNKVPLKFYFGAPSCVPATAFETSGARLSVQDVASLLDRDDIPYLAEMMNWPGVLNRDEDVMAKIGCALDRGKPVDGHAPGLRGNDAITYASAGISTDHECFTRDEALDKIRAGMKIAIREGSAAKNYNALIGLMREHAESVMFCSDDKHPDDLLVGHINELAARTLALGYNLFDVLRSCCVLPVQHYNLDVGLLRVGDPADFIVSDNLDTMNVVQTWIDGVCVYENGNVMFSGVDIPLINRFNARTCDPSDFDVNADRREQPVIVAYDGELITGRRLEKLNSENGKVLADQERDILKIAVVNRYMKARPAVAFIKNFGIRDGAIASSVAHDSHNIIVVGSSDEYISRAVNVIMEAQGGISAVTASESSILPLPVAGLMSDRPGEEVAAAYTKLSRMAREMGSELKSPFMLISFMALLVIPSLKISDKGLFDADRFELLNS